MKKCQSNWAELNVNPGAMTTLGRLIASEEKVL